MSQEKLKGGTDIISMIHYLRIAKDHAESFRREHPGTRGDYMMKRYCDRIEWIYNDLKTHPFLPSVVSEGIRNEWEADVYAVDANYEKIALLNPEQREVMESILDAVIAGEQIEVLSKI